MVIWEDEDEVTKEQLYQMNKDGIDLSKEAKKYGIKVSSLERYLRTYHREQAFPTDIFTLPQQAKIYNEFQTIETDNCMILSDIEIPDYSREYLLLALYSAMANNIKTLIIAGDFVATDMSSLNSWDATWKTNDMNYEQVIQTTRSILNTLGRWFDSIYIIEGNHDARLARKTGGEVHLGMLLNNTKAIYSRYSFLWIETSRGPIKVSHPKNYSRNPVTLGQKLHSAEPRKAHHIIAHCHRMQIGMSLDGLYEIHCLGTGRDSQLTKYKSTGVANFPEWDASFVIIENGYFKHLGLKTTDWERELGRLYGEYLSSSNVESTGTMV